MAKLGLVEKIWEFENVVVFLPSCHFLSTCHCATTGVTPEERRGRPDENATCEKYFSVAIGNQSVAGTKGASGAAMGAFIS